MKIAKIEHHGQTRYRVNDPHGPDGKRQRKFFDTREAAENFVKERTADTKAFGVHVSTIPPEERAALAFQLQRLKKLGWSLAAAVDFTLTQEGTTCTVSISPNMRTHGYGATTNTVSVVTALGCPWTVANTNNWITILSSSSGSGNGSVTYGVAANPTTNARTGVVLIGDERITFIQRAVVCTYDISPTNRVHGWGPVTGTVDVATSSGCHWTVLKTNSWLTILSSTSGSGDASVTYALSSNQSTNDRSAVIWIADVPLTLTQLGRNRLFFQPVTRLSGGHLLLRLVGPTNATCELQGSSDLIHWTRIDVVTNTTGAVEFTDAISASPGRRFYRAVRR